MVRTTLAGLILVTLGGCQHFVSVDTSRDRPVFSWPGGAVAQGLTVMPVLEDCEFDGPHSPDERIWWHISGPLRSPITYGVVPPGVAEQVKAKVLTDKCSTWVVTVTDQTMQGEATKFRVKKRGF